MIWRDDCRNFSLRCRCFDTQTEFLGGILAVSDSVFLSRLSLRALVLATLLKKSLDLHSDGAPGACAAVYLLQLRQEELVLDCFAHFVFVFAMEAKSFLSID